MSKILYYDVECRGEYDVRQVGLGKYLSGDLELLIIAYAFDDSNVRVVSIKEGSEVPSDLQQAFTNPLYTKVAFNETFDRMVLEKNIRYKDTT